MQYIFSGGVCVHMCFLVPINCVWQPVFFSFCLQLETSVVHLNLTAIGDPCQDTCTSAHTHKKKARLLITDLFKLRRTVWNEDWKPTRRQNWRIFKYETILLPKPLNFYVSCFFYVTQKKPRQAKANVKIWNCSINTDSQSNFVDTAVDKKISCEACTKITSCQSTNKHSIGKKQTTFQQRLSLHTFLPWDIFSCVFSNVDKVQLKIPLWRPTVKSHLLMLMFWPVPW